MFKALTVSVVMVVVSALGVLGSLYDLDDKIAADFPALAPYIEKIEIAFLVALIIASLALFALIVAQLREMYFGARDGDYRLFCRGLQHFICQDVKHDDLEDIQKIYSQTTDSATSLSTAEKIYNRCKKGWKKIVDTRSGQIVGYFVVLPLSRKGEDALKKREFNVTDETINDFFNTRHAKGSCAYIGMVGAEKENGPARKAALAQLIDFVNDGNYRSLYARAVTQDGLRLLKRRRFSTVIDKDSADLGVYFVKHATT